MIHLSHCSGKSYYVIGLGKTGKSVLQSLSAAGAMVSLWDDNMDILNSIGESNFSIKDPQSVDVSEFDSIILSPGINENIEPYSDLIECARKNNVPIICDVQLFMDELDIRNLGNKVIMITGTNGKSTTTVLLCHLLDSLGYDVQIGGNLGNKCVLEFDFHKADRIFVIEMSSFQIALCPNVKPHIGILLNITADHIDRHKSFENYKKIKFSMFGKQDTNDFSIIEKNTFQDFGSLDSNLRGKIVLFEHLISKPNDILEVIDKSRSESSTKYELNEGIVLNSKTNLENLAACVACMQIMGHSWNEYSQALNTFRGLEHRVELVTRLNKVSYINDSKATNAAASKGALQSFKNIFWILGGIEKYGGLSDITENLGNVKKAYLIGTAAESLSETLSNVNISNEVCGTLRNAITNSTKDALTLSEEATILFSPACSSYDQFSNFAERGNKFKEIVGEIKETHAN
jgi:UDP-N-acetylmuramoylalanine--D-glutamate ligase